MKKGLVLTLLSLISLTFLLSISPVSAINTWYYEQASGKTDPIDVDLEYDSSGNPGIAFWNNSSEVYYSYKTSTGWNTEFVGKGSTPALAYNKEGKACLLYVDSDGLEYAVRNGENSWQKSIIDGGVLFEKCSLKFNNLGQPCISYLLGYKELYYATFNGTAWQKQKVDSSYTSTALYDVSIYFDNGTPCIAYGWDAGLKFARLNGSSWAIETIDPINRPYDVSMALENGIAYVSYYDGNACDLKYAYKNGSSWTASTLESSGDVGSSARISISNSTIYLTYCNFVLNSTTKIMLKSKSLSDSDFKTEVVYSQNFGNISPSIDLALNSGHPSIVYSAFRANRVSLATMQPDIAATSCDFGGVDNSKTFTKEITVTNNGSVDLKINKVDLPTTAPFSVTGSLGTVISSGQSKVLTVSFQPTEIGKSYEDRIVIQSNDPDESTFTIQLKGHTYSYNAELSSLALSTGGSIDLSSGTLDSGTIVYSYTVPNSVSGICITPTLKDPYAKMKVFNVDVKSGASTSNINLNVGETDVPVHITSEDGTVTKEYILKITRKDSPNANLSGLVINGGSLDKLFSQDTTIYTVTLDNSDQITVTPTSAESHSIITVNEKTVASGNASSPIKFGIGTGSIIIHVLAPDKENSKDYSLTVKRLPALSGLSLSSGSLDPSFIGSNLEYSLTVKNSVDNISVAPVALEDSLVFINNNAAISGDYTDPIDLTVGENIISIEVKSKDLALNRLYTLKVKREPCLNNLSLSSGNLNTPFDPETKDYTVTVPNDINNMDVRPEVTGGASIKVNGSSVNSGEDSSEIALEEGKNTITIEVTSPDGKAFANYTITVKRLPTLDGLVLSSGTLDFNKDTLNYTVNVSNNIKSMSLKPSAKAGFSVYVKGSKVESGNESSAIALDEGMNIINIEVKSPDGEASVTYTLSVKRLLGLNSLTLSQGSLEFKQGTYGYEVTVPNSVNSIKITPEAPEGISTKIAGISVDNGKESPGILLNDGDNSITIEAVSGEEGCTLYSVVVKRLPVLTNLSINGKTIKLKPDETCYEIILPSSIDKIKLTPEADKGTNIRVNGNTVNSGESSPEIPVNIGNNTVSIITVSADGKASSTYTFTIKRLPGLSGLLINNGTLSPEFNTDTLTYNVYVSNSIESVILRPSSADAGGTVSVNGKDILSGAESEKFKLLPGRNDVITVLVTSSDGVTAEYKISVYRAYPPAPPENHEVSVGGDTTVPVGVNNNTGTVTVNLSELIDNIMDTEKDPLIKVPAVKGILTYTVELPVTSLSDNQKGNSLTLSTEIGSISVSNNMLNGIDDINGTKTAISIGQGDKSLLSNDLKETIGDRPIVQLSLAVDGRQVTWNNPNAPVTVSVPYKPTPEELANPENITVWYIDGAGKVIQVPSGKYDPKNGMVTFTTTHFSQYAVVYVQKSFDDLDNVSWAKKAVGVLASKGVLKGINENEYAPNTNITRADFLYYLVRTLGLDTAIEGNFDDVSSNENYYREIAIAKKLGITSGTSENKFSPQKSITRQDMIALTVRALKISGKIKENNNTAILQRFADKSLISAYAAQSMAAVVKEGLIVGSGSKLNPLGNTSRAEAAVFLYKLYNRH